MKRIPITLAEAHLPDTLLPLLCHAPLYDSSCSPDARVYYIDKDSGYFLKAAPKDSLKCEADMTRYFHTLGLGAEVLAYFQDDTHDWLLTSRIAGEDCTHPDYLADPLRLCDTLAQALRHLHEMTTAGCPIPDRMTHYFDTVEKNYSQGIFDTDLFFGEAALSFSSPEEAMRTVENARGAFRSDTLIHGDYCLPNVILRDFRLSGFIDLGCGGVGDRHVDLFWGIWTLRFNLGTHRYADRFMDAYGRDRIEPHLLRAVAAAEAFG